ncbi:exodeoxyribonuclease VII small subunit [Streptomyces johnsoniae]|uniref:Exodeoxyribonuclease 7 small subunit n=1 Tax=Streptomyces johnsoniae TaxID=3075532 RepID=A0ABU2S1X4_9ACTN|nr:exodeoxyribonuclease VII small subunit [Streptomyces sp. DSM 41886]MDT0443001.1 exodeoxyribonuclease VII small subunit [Streptomyces sp. DSM 41886]
MTGTTDETGTTTDGTGGAASDAALGYEQARDELIDVVRRLEAGGATLEESLALWERGEELARICGEWLEGARARLDAALARDEAAEEADEERTGEADEADE